MKLSLVLIVYRSDSSIALEASKFCAEVLKAKNIKSNRIESDFHKDEIEKYLCNSKSQPDIGIVLGGDGTFDVWGRFVENKIVDILIYSFGTYNTLYEDDFEIEKTKECTIDIYSGRIGIDEPNELDKNGFVQPVLNLECPNKRQQYDIFELSLKFKSFGTELLGTHIELEPDNKITKNEIKELMKEIIINEEEQNA